MQSQALEPESSAVVITMTPETKKNEMELSSKSYVQEAIAFQITNQETYNRVAAPDGILVAIANYKAKIVDHYKESKDLAHRTHARICADEKMLLAPAIEAESIYKNKVMVFEKEMKRLQDEEDRKLRAREEEERKARENLERQRMIDNRMDAYDRIVNERLRLADEAAANHASPEAIVDILRAPMTGLPPIPMGMSDLQTRNLQRYVDDQKMKLAEKADTLRASQPEVEEMITEPLHEKMADVPVYIPPSTVPSISAPAQKLFTKSSALTTKTKYKAEVYDIRLLCRAIADGKVSPMYVEPAQSKLNTVANAERDTLNIPGVRAVPDSSISTNKRRGGK
jgi:hypothetical protein